MTDQPPKLTRLDRWAKVALGIGPFLAVAAVLLCWEIGGRRALDRAIQEARSTGEPLTFEELMAHRRVWPRGHDAAEVLLALEPRLQELDKENSAFLRPLPLLGNVELPPLGHRWTPEVDAITADALARMDPELRELDRLKDYQGGNWPFVVSQDVVENVTQNLRVPRFAAKLKALQATADAIHGDSSRLADNVAVMLRVSGLLRDYPGLTGALQKTAIDSLAVDTIQRCVGFSLVSPTDLAAMERALAQSEEISPLYWGVTGERALFLQIVEQALRSAGDADERGIPAGKTPGFRGWFVRDEAFGLRLYTRLVAASKDPQRGLAAARQLGAENEGFSKQHPFTSMLFHSFERAFELGMISTAQVRAARIGLALERYRLETGGFPERLDQLIPAYLGQLPLDPFDGSPLRYGFTDRAAIVYSVGPDGVDNGGDVETPQPHQGSRDWGFTLFCPEHRNLPPSMPPAATSTPSAASSKPGSDR